MARNNQPNHPARVTQPHEPPSPDLIEKFLDLQNKELELRTEQLSIDAQHEENNKLIAQASIEANVQDRKDHRSHIERRTKLMFIGSTIIIVIVACFCGFALFIGKGEVVNKMIEVIAIFTAGFAGGYGTKSAKSSHPPNQEKKE